MGHNSIDDTKKSSEILDFWKPCWVTIWPFLGQYLSFGVGQVRTHDHLLVQTTPQPIRSKLQVVVDIEVSRYFFGIIFFIPRDTCNKSEVTVLARSSVTTHLIDTFLTSTDSENPWKWEMGECSIGDGKRGLVRRNRTKLTFVNQKVFMNLMSSFSSFPTLWTWTLIQYVKFSQVTIDNDRTITHVIDFPFSSHMYIGHVIRNRRSRTLYCRYT